MNYLKHSTYIMIYLKRSNKPRLRHFLHRFSRLQCIWVAGVGGMALAGSTLYAFPAGRIYGSSDWSVLVLDTQTEGVRHVDVQDSPYYYTSRRALALRVTF